MLYNRLASDGTADAKKIALKLHKQFGHPTADKLISLMKNGGVKDKQIFKCVNDIAESCEICDRFKKARPSPIVSMPMASKFNELVAMDLKICGKCYFLVLVDHATRFCSAIVINNKRPETIIKGIFLSWISFFGAPSKFLSDNGGEFNNCEMRELGEQFNIKIMTTSAESPWSNGVCERLNAVLGRSVQKIQEDTGCSLEIALAWAVSARNALSNFSGFCPNQLVFGFNPVLPSIFQNDPPALDVPEASQIVKDNLNALHKAREDFIKVEADERIKRALRHNIRETLADDLQAGEEVFYKREGSDRWHGPGVVIGRDGKQVLVRHGGVYVRVHSCRLSKVPNKVCEEPSSASNTEREQAESDRVRNFPSSNLSHYPIEDDTPTPVSSRDEDCEDDEDDHLSTDNEVSEPPVSTAMSSEAPTVVLPQQNSNLSAIGRKPKVGLRIQGVHSETGELVSGKIVSRAGKSTGKYKNCFNLESDSDGTTSCINLDQDLSSWKVVSDEEEMLVLFNSTEVVNAKEKEIANWLENDVYEEVEYTNQSLLSVRWVVTEKVKNGEEIVKARLVVRGFEEDPLDLRKDSPTCCKESVRLALSVACSRDWECHSIDVKAAYLQGNKIERDVHIMPPPEFFTGKVWKLKKTVYGLRDAARAWYLRVKSELHKLGVSASTLDPALFYWKDGGEHSGVICVYVDDFLWAGTKEFEAQVIKQISNLFTIGGVECKAFKYIGLNIETHGDGVWVDQNKYASTISRLEVSRERAMNKQSDVSERERTNYKAAIGQLNWIASHSRPDISFEVCELSTLSKCAKVSDLFRLNKVIDSVTRDHQKILFPKMQSLDQCELECYSDASFGNLSDGGSQGAFIIFLKDRNGKRCPILWQSRKVRRVVKSTLSAETMALLDCAEAAVYIGYIFSEVSGCHPLQVNCFVDNKSLVDALYSTHQIEDRRLRIDMAVLRGMLESKEVRHVHWVASAQQLADCLTKRGASTVQLREAVSVV